MDTNASVGMKRKAPARFDFTTEHTESTEAKSFSPKHLAPQKLLNPFMCSDAKVSNPMFSVISVVKRLKWRE